MTNPTSPAPTPADSEMSLSLPLEVEVASCPRLAELPVAQRDAVIAEVMVFLLERGYTITAPGSTAAVSASGHFGFAARG